MRLTVGKDVREVGPRDMWHVPSDVNHGGEIAGDEAVVFIDVYSPASEEHDGSVTYYEWATRQETKCLLSKQE